MKTLQRILTHDDCEIQLVEVPTRQHWTWGGYVRLGIIKVPRDVEPQSIHEQDLIILTRGKEVKGCDQRPGREYARTLERLQQEMRVLEELDDLYIEITSANTSSQPILFQHKRI